MRALIVAIIIVITILTIRFILSRNIDYSCWVGWKNISIEQTVSIRSVISGTYYVATHVWVNNWLYMPISAEYWDVEVVTKDDIEKEKIRQMQEATKIYNKVIKKLKGE